MPIVWHVIQLYAVQGFRRFLLATGYRGELIERFVAAHAWPPGVSVECVDTGLRDARRAGGSSCCEPRLAGEERFCVDLRRRRRRHRPGRAAGVPLRARRAREHDRGAPAAAVRRDRAGRRRPRDRLSREADAPSTGSTAASSASTRPCWTTWTRDSVLERAPLERLAAAGELRAHRHEGFWECMDTYKDAVALNDLWASGGLPGGCGTRRRGGTPGSAAAGAAI